MSGSRDISGSRRVSTVWVNAQEKRTFVIHKRDCPLAIRLAGRDHDGQRWFIAPADVIKAHEPGRYPVISTGKCCGGTEFPSGTHYTDPAETHFCRCGHTLGTHRAERFRPYSWVCSACNCMSYKEVANA